MTEIQLDITGKICPFCLLIVQKKVDKIASGDTLIVKCDHPPAANDTIPRAMKKRGYPIEVHKLEPGLWELKIDKK